MNLYFDLPVIKSELVTGIMEEGLVGEEDIVVENAFRDCLTETYKDFDLLAAEDEVLSRVRNCVKESLDYVPEESIQGLWKFYMGRNRRILEILEELRKESLYKGNRFRTQAYRKAISVVESLRVPIISGKQAQRLPGIGAKIAKKIDEILETGELEAIRRRTPGERKRIDVLKEFGEIWGVGPKTAIQLYNKGYRNVRDIPLKELNAKQRIGLKYYDDLQKRIPRSEIELFEAEVREILEEFDPKLKSRSSSLALRAQDPSTLKMCICGSYRRGLPTSGDIDLLIAYEGRKVPKDLFKRILSLLRRRRVIIEDLAEGAEVYNGITQTSDGVARRLDIHFVPIEEWGSQTLYFTGSKEFNIDMRNLAIRQGLKLSDKGLFDKSNKRLPLSTEDDIFNVLGLPYIEPQDRKDLSKWI